MLLENAVKHNIISGENPLRVIIGKLDTGELFVENNLQFKSPVEGSNKTGLKNLRERYQFLTNKEMEIKQNDKFFRVTIPLIKLET
jgi:LytS/YehU family sensor histidine kinase